MKRLHVWKVALGLLGVCLPLAAQGTSQSGYQKLVTLDKEFLDFTKPKLVDGIRDYGSDAMKAQKKGLENFRQRLAAIDADSWPVPQKVDYLLVWARLNELDFAHRVMRPWARDPMLYLDLVNKLPYIEVPGPRRQSRSARSEKASSGYPAHVQGRVPHQVTRGAHNHGPGPDQPDGARG